MFTWWMLLWLVIELNRNYYFIWSLAIGYVDISCFFKVGEKIPQKLINEYSLLSFLFPFLLLILFVSWKVLLIFSTINLPFLQCSELQLICGVHQVRPWPSQTRCQSGQKQGCQVKEGAWADWCGDDLQREGRRDFVHVSWYGIDLFPMVEQRLFLLTCNLLSRNSLNAAGSCHVYLVSMNVFFSVSWKNRIGAMIIKRGWGIFILLITHGGLDLLHCSYY